MAGTSGNLNSNDWKTVGNEATTPSPYNDNGAQVGNFIGTTDNQPVEIYTNAADPNAKTDLRLLTATPAAQAVSAPVDILQIRRNGKNAVVWPQSFSIALGHWWTDVSARTRADFRLANGNVNTPDFTTMSLFSSGGVGINGNGTAGDWAWYAGAGAAGGIGRGNGGALLALNGLNGSNVSGPHIGIWTTLDTYPLFYQLNWAHNNIGMIFDGFYDGAWKAAHTTRPYALYKINDSLNFYGSAAAPAAAGDAWTQDLMGRWRYAGATLAGGELDFANVAKNRRVVLFDVSAASDNQFYGLGYNNGAFRYQVGVQTAAHRFYAATGANTSQQVFAAQGNGAVVIDPDNLNTGGNPQGGFSLLFGGGSGEGITSKRNAGGNQFGIDFWSAGNVRMSITNIGRFGFGTQSPTAMMHVSAANGNANAASPLLRLSDTNIPNSFAAVDNGVNANAYRLLAVGANLELQAAANSNQVVISTNGGVGFGTNTPNAGNGNISVGVNGFKPGGGAWGTFSDRRVKRDIKPVSWGLAEILKLHPVSFQYNGKAGTLADGKTHYSLIAQDVKDVLPDFVEEIPIDEETYAEMETKDKKLFDNKLILGLKEGLTNFEAILIQAVKDLAEQNKALSDRVAALERQAV